MIEEEEHAADQLPLEGAGQKLRLAREEQKLSLAQVAAETRIPTRHLEVIERGDFAALPARTYAIGFTRTYAKMLGLDQRALADEVRAELALAREENRDRHATFEPGDPAKVPSVGLVWFSIIAALLLIAGIVAFYGSYFAPGSGPASLLEGDDQTEDDAALLADAEAGADAGAIDPDGEVVFTALEEGLWVRFYDGSGERFQESQMSLGETFTVPADASDPQIWTGRPDAFAITIDGQSVPKLAEEDGVMRDVAISAEALLARDAGEDAPQLADGSVGADDATDQARPVQPGAAPSAPAQGSVASPARTAPEPTATTTPAAATRPTPVSATSPAPAPAASPTPTTTSSPVVQPAPAAASSQSAESAPANAEAEGSN